MASALCYRPDASAAELVFEVRAGSYNEDAVLEFLEQLRAHLRGDKVTLIWDGLQSHKSRKTQAYIASHRRWLVVERLPAYAPDLNPCEGLWGNLKGTELANLCSDTLAQPIEQAHAGVARVRRDDGLLFAFLRGAGLSL